MDVIVDRRQQPRGKNLGNRQRFIRRARAQIRGAIRENLKNRGITDAERGETVSIPRDDVHEPRFVPDPRAGRREHVLPGNREFVEGDRIARPEGGGGSGTDGSPEGEGEDAFTFQLSRDEFLDLFFEDLELPDLVKTRVASETSTVRQRAGFTTDGPPVRMNLERTMRHSMARRVALRRPSGAAIEAMERELEQLRSGAITPADGASTPTRIAEIEALLARAQARRARVPFIDPIDLRYNFFDSVPRAVTQAVMFCLMDVSASMDEDMKDLAKRFFMLLHLFLVRQYERVEVVFIRHTQQAEEVDEETFFHDRLTGGTIVSSAFEEMLRIVKDRFPVEDWNLYLAQASDGDDWREDLPRCVELLNERILPICQYGAYVEVARNAASGQDPLAGNPSALWNAYDAIEERHAHFARRGIARPADIYPVFRDLFHRSGIEA